MISTTPLPPSPSAGLPALVAIDRPHPPVHTLVLPLHLVALDIEVREKYLSDDLTTICDIAGKSNSAVLIASAGLPQENRETSFAIWRRQGLDKLAVAVPEIWDFLATNAQALTEYQAATIDLLHLDRLLHDDLVEKKRVALVLLLSRKQALKDALTRNTPDIIEGRFPKWCVVRGDGEMSLFHSRSTAQEWARVGNTGFHLIPLATVDRTYSLAK